MKTIGKYILTGLITTLPVILTLYILYWLAVTAETLLADLVPRGIYLPGMGVATALLVMLVIGMMMHTRPIRRLFIRAERIFYILPLVKTVYSAFRDFMDFLSPARKKKLEQVVAVTLGETGMHLIGFVTQAENDQLPEEFQDGDNVMVYLPMSYQLGGYAVLVPRASVRPLNMSMEEAMRFVLTAGITRLSAP